MKTINKTIILFASAVVVAASSGTAYAFFFFAMKDKAEETAQLSLTSEALSNNESRLSTSLSAIKGENENVDKLSGYFIKESEIVAFTQKMELLGVQSGTALTLESLEPTLDVKKEPVLNFRLKATGSFKDVMRLIVLLENFPAKFEWDTVQVGRDDGLLEGGSPTTGKPGAKKGAPTSPLWSLSISLRALNFIKE
jgi:hypothetical protein